MSTPELTARIGREVSVRHPPAKVESSNDHPARHTSSVNRTRNKVTALNRFPRSSGILCHVTSLPVRWGIGDLGSAAYRFVDWLTRAGQGLWQVLPLGPPGYGESPYQCFSAF